MLNRLKTKLLSICRSIARQWREAEEIHNRQQALMDERYTQNWYSIRGIR